MMKQFYGNILLIKNYSLFVLYLKETNFQKLYILKMLVLGVCFILDYTHIILLSLEGIATLQLSLLSHIFFMWWGLL